MDLVYSIQSVPLFFALFSIDFHIFYKGHSHSIVKLYCKVSLTCVLICLIQVPRGDMLLMASLVMRAKFKIRARPLCLAHMLCSAERML